MAKKKAIEFIRVDEWEVPKKSQYVGFINKVFVIPFDEIFGVPEYVRFNNFIIKKDNYSKQLPFITKYINYFLEYYDSEKELLMAYLKIKALLDNKPLNISIKQCIKLAYSILLTDSMVSKIKAMVKDNYYTDLTASTSDNKQYADILQFNNDHGRALMEVSTAMKIICPVLFHYFNTRKLTKADNFIYRFYEKLFELFGPGYNLYGKLWATISSKINKNYASNNKIWDQREILGTTKEEVLDKFLEEKLISDNMFRYAFSGNVVSFNSTIINNQLLYFLDETYPYDMVQLSIEKDSEGLSMMDKFEIANTITDESISILARPSIKQTIKKLKKKIRIHVSKKEIRYYMRNHNINKFQSELVLYFFVKYFGGYRDLMMLTRTQYFRLLIMLKKYLQARGQVYLPQILTSNLEGKLNSRMIQNMKFINKIQSSSVYKQIVREKFMTLFSFDTTASLIRPLSSVLNSAFSFVEFKLPEIVGERIEVNEDILSDEILQFINMI